MKPALQKYRTTSWKTYNEALEARGSLLIWLDPTMNLHGQPSGKRGRSQRFSDEAIQFCLSIKCLFTLPLRQAMGMAQRLLRLAGLDWPVPDYSTVSRRQDARLRRRTRRRGQTCADVRGSALPAGCSSAAPGASSPARGLRHFATMLARMPSVPMVANKASSICPPRRINRPAAPVHRF